MFTLILHVYNLPNLHKDIIMVGWFMVFNAIFNNISVLSFYHSGDIIADY